MKLFDRVVTQNMDGRYNNVQGTIVEIHNDLDAETVYSVQYDNPIGSITRGMFKRSDLKQIP